MIFRHDTHLSVTVFATSKAEGIASLAPLVDEEITWHRIDTDSAFHRLSSMPDRHETIHTLRAMLAYEAGPRASHLIDEDILRLAAARLGNGWVCTIERAPVGIGWNGKGIEKADYATEAIEPEEKPTGIPKKKEKDHWIIVELLGENGEPIPNELCRITLPDGQVIERETNSLGRVEEYHIVKGDCAIEFPELDKDAWEPYRGAAA